MTDYLAAEPQTDPDAVFRNFQRHNLAHAAAHFAVTVTGPPTFGWRLRSIGAPATGPHGTRWLRVVSEEPQWANGYGWTGNLDANVLDGLAKPSVLDVTEWTERDWRNQRAELLTVLPGTPCSPTDVLQQPPPVNATWWAELRRSLTILAGTATERNHADQERVTSRIHDRFGGSVDTTVTEWATAHGDLHWSNLMAPEFGLLDWELWGTAPAGTDAATLLCYSLLVPDVAEQIRAMFADRLDTETGRIAQLYVIARLFRRVDGGDYPQLAEPLRQHAHTLLDL